MIDWNSIFLAFVQGVTEFLPVSSSGHLFLWEHIFKKEPTELSFVLLLHGATFFSILLVFFKDLQKFFLNFKKKAHIHLGYKVCVSLLPLGFVGLFFKTFVEQSFQKNIVAFGFLSTGLLLFSLFFKKTKNSSLEKISFRTAFLIGLAQALAVFPGFSRSAWTIAAGLYSGLAPRAAVYYSFLISLPAILASIFMDLLSKKLKTSSEGFFTGLWDWNLSFWLSFFLAFLSGFISLLMVLKLVQADKLQLFSFYLLPLGLILVFFL